MKIVLVDDETLLLDSLESIIDWNSYDLELVGMASSGEMALDICRNHAVDLVITDIKMRGMDGLELTSKLAQEFPKIKVIIMSSYDDFSYAKKAITLKVSNYLLKINTDKIELLNAILEVKNELELSNSNTSILEANKLSKELNLTRDIFLGTEKDYRLLNIKGTQFVMMAISFDNEQLSIQEHLNFLITLIQKFNNNICYTEYKNSLYIFTPIEGTEYRHIALRLKSQLSIQHSSCSVVVSSIHTIDQVNLAFRETTIAMEERFYAGKNTLVLYSDALINNVTLLSYDIFLPYLINSNYTAIEEHIRAIFEDCETHSTYSKKQLTRLIDYILISLTKNSCSGKELNEFNDKVMQLEQTTYFTDYCNLTYELLSEITSLNAHLTASPLITNSIRFIMEHYTQPISLHDIADYLCVNPAYLSRLFKKETGETITNYIQVFKIDKAKKLLLEDEYNIVEIAALLGFDSSSYFTTIFQKHLGCSPSEYRKHFK